LIGRGEAWYDSGHAGRLSRDEWLEWLPSGLDAHNSAAGALDCRRWPILGVAVAAVAFAINGVAARLETTSCLACGADLADQPVGIRGRLCPKCGAINERGIADPEQRADAGGADDAPQA